MTEKSQNKVFTESISCNLTTLNGLILEDYPRFLPIADFSSL